MREKIYIHIYICPLFREPMSTPGVTYFQNSKLNKLTLTGKTWFPDKAWFPS